MKIFLNLFILLILINSTAQAGNGQILESVMTRTLPLMKNEINVAKSITDGVVKTRMSVMEQLNNGTGTKIGFGQKYQVSHLDILSSHLPDGRPFRVNILSRRPGTEIKSELTIYIDLQDSPHDHAIVNDIVDTFGGSKKVISVAREKAGEKGLQESVIIVPIDNKNLTEITDQYSKFNQKLDDQTLGVGVVTSRVKLAAH
jgi:hypothetical protein